jgi:hypothetical protein
MQKLMADRAQADRNASSKMSDKLQLVVLSLGSISKTAESNEPPTGADHRCLNSTNLDDKLKRIGHLLDAFLLA